MAAIKKPCKALRAPDGGTLNTCERKAKHRGKHRNANGFEWKGDARKDGKTR